MKLTNIYFNKKPAYIFNMSKKKGLIYNTVGISCTFCNIRHSLNFYLLVLNHFLINNNKHVNKEVCIKYKVVYNKGEMGRFRSQRESFRFL